MPKKPSIPQLRPHKASGQGRVILGGRHVYCGPWGTPECRRTYDEAVAEWLAAGRPGRPRRPAAPADVLTVRGLALRYEDHARAYYRGADGEDTRQTQRITKALDALVKLYGPEPAAEFGVVKLTALRDYLLTRPSEKDPAKLLSRTYVNNLVGCITTAWRWAATKGLVPDDRAAGLGSLRAIRKGRGGVETPAILPADPAAVVATLPHLPPIVRAMVELQTLTGMRPGEILRLRPREVSRRATQRLTLSTGQRVAAVPLGDVLVWVYAPPAHKTAHRDKPRVVAIGPRAQAVLAPYLERDLGTFCFSPIEATAAWRASQRTARKTPVQPSQVDRSRKRPRWSPGERYTTDSYRQAVQRACRRAGVEPWHPNQLRHSVADQVSEHATEDAASAVLGNTLDAVRTYTLQRIGQAAKVMAQLG